MTQLDHTHDPEARSWLASANTADTDFPVQNLPFGVFRRKESQEHYRGGVAIGDQVLDLQALAATQLLSGPAGAALALAAKDSLHDLMAAGPGAWRALRHALFDLLKQGAARIGFGESRGRVLPAVSV